MFRHIIKKIRFICHNPASGFNKIQQNNYVDSKGGLVMYYRGYGYGNKGMCPYCGGMHAPGQCPMMMMPPAFPTPPVPMPGPGAYAYPLRRYGRTHDASNEAAPRYPGVLSGYTKNGKRNLPILRQRVKLTHQLHAIRKVRVFTRTFRFCSTQFVRTNSHSLLRTPYLLRLFFISSSTVGSFSVFLTCRRALTPSGDPI